MTQIPIDYANAPFKTKYLTEETFLLNRWCIGSHSPGITHVEIHDGCETILENVPIWVARQIIAHRDAFCHSIELMFGYTDPERVWGAPKHDK